MKRFFSLIPVLLLTLIIASTTHAQVAPPDPLSTRVIPQYPGPNTEVFIEVESFVTDLNRADIRFIVDGTTIQRGGEKTFTLTTGDLGERTEVSIVALTQDAQRYEKTLVFVPATVDLVWEADTYTPPFYQGKAQITAENTITIHAIARLSTNGSTLLSPDNLVYTWRLDRRELDQSGQGQDTITITGPQLFQDMVISVDVSSFGGSLRASKSLQLEAGAPELILYEKHPLLGIRYEEGFEGDIALTETEETLRVEPYFFSTEDIRNNNLIYRWEIDNTPFSPQGNPAEATFREVSGEGSARVSIEIENIAKLLQSAGHTFILAFGRGSLSL